jgi:hypothetical protein
MQRVSLLGDFHSVSDINRAVISHQAANAKTTVRAALAARRSRSAT